MVTVGRIDRTQFSVAKLTDKVDSLEWWLSRPVSERLEGIELLRRTFYGDAVGGRLSEEAAQVDAAGPGGTGASPAQSTGSAALALARVLEVVKLERR